MRPKPLIATLSFASKDALIADCARIARELQARQSESRRPRSTRIIARRVQGVAAPPARRERGSWANTIVLYTLQIQLQTSSRAYVPQLKFFLFDYSYC
jgi:hypothetical protein